MMRLARARRVATLEKIRCWILAEVGLSHTMEGPYYVLIDGDGAHVGAVALVRRSWWLTEVKQLYVVPELRRRGLGRELMTRAALAIRTPVAVSTVRADNAACLALNRSLGFREVADFKREDVALKMFLIKPLREEGAREITPHGISSGA